MTTAPLTILLVHNFYQQAGGEDKVFQMERQLLEAQGHRVFTYTLHNDDLRNLPGWRAALETLWNRAAASALAALVRAHGVQVVHFHNPFPRVSPAAYSAVRKAGAVVVQTLHNYRLACAGGLLYRNGKPCEACVKRWLPLPGMAHRCYRNSLAASAVVVLMQVFHRCLGTWRRHVDAYIILTEGARARFAPGLLPSKKLHVLGNFLPESPEPGPLPAGGYALFIGRLEASKGVRTLLAAWAMAPEGMPDLVLAGDGALGSEVELAAARDPRIRWAGLCDPARIQALLAGSVLLLLPSRLFEGFPMVVLEAWAAGRPVVASDLGAMAELITPGQDGWLVDPFRPEAWASQIRALTTTPAPLAKAGMLARQGFKQHHTEVAHAAGLEKIYAQAIKAAGCLR